VSLQSTVTARRIRAGDCHIAGKGVDILSALTAADLTVDAGYLGLLVRKRLGVSSSARVRSGGPLYFGSLYSMMTDLPTPHQTTDMALASFESGLKQSLEKSN
jgi:hypothetical protein